MGETEVSIVAQNKDCYESGIVCIKFLVIHVGLTKIYFTDNSGNPVSAICTLTLFMDIQHIDKSSKNAIISSESIHCCWERVRI